jgi:phage terminase large subunit-like protein
VFVALPRKQAKTTLIAGEAGFCLLGECQGKQGQQIYSASGDHKQAALIFKTLATMIRADEYLAARCQIYETYKRIVFEPLNNTYEALSSEASLKHGLSPSHVIFDEVHVLPNRELHDVLTTGFGARREPLTIYITTAGWNRHTICYELWDYARKVRDGEVDDPTFLPILYEAGPDDDWTDEAVWHKAMPALDDFCSLEFIRDECRRAKEMPAYENTFRQLYLNQWTEQAVRWMSMDRWGRSAGKVDADALVGRECYGGLDLSQTRDLTAFVLVFPDDDGGYQVLCRFWAPEDGAWRDEHRNRDLYREWARRGYLTLTPGEVIDYQMVEEEIVELSRRYYLTGLFADRAMALHLCLRLRDTHGIDVEFLPQTPMCLNGPTREVERLVLAEKLRHGNNPVLTWCASNAAVRRNTTGLILLDKARSTGRIDGLAATVNAIARATSSGGEGGPSVYEDHDVLIF